MKRRLNLMKLLLSQTFRLIMELVLLILTLLVGLFISFHTVVTTSTIALTSMITFLFLALICLSVAVASTVVIWYIQRTGLVPGRDPQRLYLQCPVLQTLALILVVILCILTWVIFLRLLIRR